MVRDIYGMDKQLDRAITLCREDLTRGAYISLMQYKNYCEAKGFSNNRIRKVLSILRLSAIMSGKTLTLLEDTDVMQLMSEINKTRKSGATRNDYRIVLRGYFKFAFRNQKKKYRKLRHLLKNKKCNQVRAPIRRIQESDMPSILNATGNPEMKLLLSLLWETGARIGELLNLRKEDIEFGENIFLNLDGKTGKRKIVVVENAEALRKNASVASGLYLFEQDHRKFTIELKRIQKITGLPELYAHLFRKSRASTLLQNVPEQIVKKYLGWTPDSKMLKHYSFISGEEANNAILKMHQNTNRYAPQMSLQKHSFKVNLRNYDRKFQKISRFSA